jgi:hypothetical protein
VAPWTSQLFPAAETIPLAVLRRDFFATQSFPLRYHGHKSGTILAARTMSLDPEAAPVLDTEASGVPRPDSTETPDRPPEQPSSPRPSTPTDTASVVSERNQNEDQEPRDVASGSPEGPTAQATDGEPGITIVEGGNPPRPPLPMIHPQAQRIGSQLRSAVFWVEESLVRLLPGPVPLPPALQAQIVTLRRLGRELGGFPAPPPPPPDEDDDVKCEVQRMTMKDWRERDLEIGPVAATAITAFYRNVPSTESQTIPSVDVSETGPEKERTQPAKGEMPQRIAISSALLIEDLEQILGDGITEDPLMYVRPAESSSGLKANLV